MWQHDRRLEVRLWDKRSRGFRRGREHRHHTQHKRREGPFPYFHKTEILRIKHLPGAVRTFVVRAAPPALQIKGFGIIDEKNMPVNPGTGSRSGKPVCRRCPRACQAAGKDRRGNGHAGVTLGNNFPAGRPAFPALPGGCAKKEELFAEIRDCAGAILRHAFFYSSLPPSWGSVPRSEAIPSPWRPGSWSSRCAR